LVESLDMVIMANSRILDIHTLDRLEHTRAKSHQRSINLQARQLVRNMVNTPAVKQRRSIHQETNRISQHLVIVKAKAKIKVSSLSVNKVSHTGKTKVIPLILVKLHLHTHNSHILRTISHRRAHIHPNLDKISINKVSTAKGRVLALRVGNTVPLHRLMAKCLEHLDIILTKVPLGHMDNMDRVGTAGHHMSCKAKGTMVNKATNNKRQVVILGSMLSLNNLISQAGKRFFFLNATNLTSCG